MRSSLFGGSTFKSKLNFRLDTHPFETVLRPQEMFSRIKKKGETEIDVMLDEPLTSESCTKVVMELVKYILYQKQQIPFAYETLAQLQTRMKVADRDALSFKTLSNTLKSVSDNLSSQFFLDGCDIKEVAILLGATILSPKLCIGIELPSYVLNSELHNEHQHSSRKPLLKLMRSMLECEEFQEALSIPSSITNIFIMLKKSDSNLVSEFFLPKPQYAPPTQIASCFKIKLRQNHGTDLRCNCRTLIRVYHDCYDNRSVVKEDDNVQYVQHENSAGLIYRWYQSKQIVKGFKFHL